MLLLEVDLDKVPLSDNIFHTIVRNHRQRRPVERQVQVV